MSMLNEAIQIKEDFVGHRRYFHQNPEIQMNLPGTTAYVMEKLTQMGYEPKEICPCGVVAIAGKKEGKTLLIRADMDALNMVEQTDLPFKSTNQYMHACGHDMHAAMLLGIAQLLKNHEDELNGKVKLMFQPAEENLQGSRAMIEAGVMENPKVDAAIAAHTESGLPGSIQYHLGTMYASSDFFKIIITGKSSDASLPETGVDPIIVGSHLFLNLQSIRSRESNALKPLIITFGKFQGGDTARIIPESVVMEGAIRTYDKGVRTLAKKRLQEIVKETASMFGASAEVEFLYGAPPLINNREFALEMAGYAKEVLPEEYVYEIKDSIMASEDFAYIAEMVPSVLWFVGTSFGDETVTHHHPEVVFNEDGMTNNVAAVAHAAIEWLKNN